MPSLSGNTALITGAAMGMGTSHARRFVEEGARVVITDMNVDAGKALADELGDGALFWSTTWPIRRTWSG
jgi:3alpha(or 20beta)-hydroxysteroid dehydrogenase